MSPFKIQHSNDVHQFLDDISDCWFVFFFHIASRIDRKPILVFFADCMTLIGSTPMVCQKHLHFFHIWRLQIGVHHTFLLNGVHHTFFAEICCRLFTDKCHQSIEMRPFWFETSIHRNETILIWNYSNFSVNWPNANYVVLFNSKRFLFAMK